MALKSLRSFLGKKCEEERINSAGKMVVTVSKIDLDLSSRLCSCYNQGLSIIVVHLVNNIFARLNFP